MTTNEVITIVVSAVVGGSGFVGLATSVLKSWQDALMAVFVAVTQGILSAGCSVYVNQIVKQAGKGDE